MKCQWLSKNSVPIDKFDIAEEDNLIRDFEKETHTFIDLEKQIRKEEREKEWDMEL